MFLKIKCKLTGFESLMYNSSELDYCTNKSAALKTFIEFIALVKTFVGETAFYGCPLPCKQTTYGFNLNYFHKNSWVETDEITVKFFSN